MPPWYGTVRRAMEACWTVLAIICKASSLSLSSTTTYLTLDRKENATVRDIMTCTCLHGWSTSRVEADGRLTGDRILNNHNHGTVLPSALFMD